MTRLAVWLAAVGLAAAPAGAAAGAAPVDYAGWHLPLPAGEWLISRGPCGSGARFRHECGYYENRCAVDFVAADGLMDNVPVLAPAPGRALFIGERAETGKMVMLQHQDGRVSAFMHLAAITVGLDEPVAAGRVIGLAGRSGTTQPHLHFFVQPNAVDRDCLPLDGLDGLDFRSAAARSRNLGWDRLVLPATPPPDWLVVNAARAAPGTLMAPRAVVLTPGQPTTVTLAIAGQFGQGDFLRVGGALYRPWTLSADYAVYHVPLTGGRREGSFIERIALPPLTSGAAARASFLRYIVTEAPHLPAGDGVLLNNPDYLSPSSFLPLTASPELCWRVPASAGLAPLRYRALVVGPEAADSGWIDESCWQAPALPEGVYLWKVFVRDARGWMNRTNQRPFAFVIR